MFELGDAAHDRWLEAEGDRLLEFGRAARHPDGGFGWLDDDGRPGAGPPGRAVDHLPDDARLRARAPARPARLRRARRPRGRRADRPVPRRRARRLVRRGRRRRSDGHATRRPTSTPSSSSPPPSATGRRTAGRPGAARRGARRAPRAASGTTTPAWSSSSGTAVHDARRLPRRQRQHAHRRGVPRGRRRHRDDRAWRPRAADRQRVVHGSRPSARRGGSRSTSTRLDAAAGVQRRRRRRTRSGPTARRSGTGWSGRGWPCTCAPRLGRRGARRGCSTTPRSLFDAAVREGWAVDGADGFVYTVDWAGQPGRARADALGRRRGHRGGRRPARRDRRRVVRRLVRSTGGSTSPTCFRDPEHGSWHHELSPTNQPSGLTWQGKPDIYHAFQATLIPRLPLPPMLARALADGRLA